MKKILCIILMLMMFFTACGDTKKESAEAVDEITVFDTYSRSFNMGEKELKLKFYTSDYKLWKNSEISAKLNIGTRAFEAAALSVEIEDELVNERYYVGELTFVGKFEKANGEASLDISFDNKASKQYAIGYISVAGEETQVNNYFGNLTATGIKKTKDGKIGNYGLLVHIEAFQNVYLWGMLMGIDHVYADTSLIYEIKPSEIDEVKKLISEGRLDERYENCYTRRPGNNSCMAGFNLKAGEHYIYVPFQFENGFYDVSSSVFTITFSADNLAPSEYITKEFTYINE